MAMWKIVLVCILFACTVNGLSFLNKYKMMHFGKNARVHGKMYSGKELIGKSCKDNVDYNKCKMLKGFCESDESIRENCPKTCGVCQSTQPTCQKSAFGCCWDNITAAIGQEKKCPPCIDDSEDCTLLKINCDDAVTRRLCPVSCGVNCGSCQDDPHQAEICPAFKDIGACESEKGLMEKYCPKTCLFC